MGVMRFVALAVSVITAVGVIWFWEIHAGNDNDFFLDFKGGQNATSAVALPVGTASIPGPLPEGTVSEPVRNSVPPAGKPGTEPIIGLQVQGREPSLIVSPQTVLQGGTLLFTVELSSGQSVLENESEAGVLLEFDGRALRTFRLPGDSNRMFAVAGVDVKGRVGDREVVLQVKGHDPVRRSVRVKGGNFPTTDLVLSETQKAQGETPESAIASIVQNDNALIYEALKEPDQTVYISGAFLPPLRGSLVDVGGFGVIRKSGGSAIRHLGVDLGARRGDPVQASQGGRVRLARSLTNFGNTIIIDHGASIFTLYLHLDSMGVEEGDEVRAGDRIGAVGETGAYSLDPHLHFSVKIGDASLDPLEFLRVVEGLW